MEKTYIGISLDKSASMSSIVAAAQQDYNQTIGSIRSSSEQAGQDTIVSVVNCGVGRNALVTREVVNSSVAALQPITRYVADGNATPLLDSIGELITLLESAPDANTASFLVMAITDGGENSSKRWSWGSLASKIRTLTQTDRWTFVVRVPRGYRGAIARNLGLPEGNILEWETTERGMRESTVATESAFTGYYQARSAGKTSTQKFYTDMKDVKVEDVKAALTDISHLVNVWLVTEKAAIRPFVEKMSGKDLIKGAAFYQLTKTESEVQDYKQVIIRDKKSGAVYGGKAARQLLGLPTSGMTRVVPGDHGQYDVYLQSTSVNRALPAGTQLLYWPTFDAKVLPAAVAPATSRSGAILAPSKTPKVTKPRAVSPVVKAVAKTPLNATPGDEYVNGYKAGYADGKAKSNGRHHAGRFGEGYSVGYKDGRGHKSRLFK